MAIKHIPDGQDFNASHFSPDFGFTGSARGRHDARNRTPPPDPEYGDGSYVENQRLLAKQKMARGGPVRRAMGGPAPDALGAGPAAPGMAPAASPLSHATITMPVTDAAAATARAVRGGQALGAKQAIGALGQMAARARSPGPPGATMSPVAAPPAAPAQQGIPQMARGGRVPKKSFHPGGEKGKLHREMGVAEGQKIPADRLQAATHSKNPEVRRDAIRAKTMMGWHHGKKE